MYVTSDVAEKYCSWAGTDEVTKYASNVSTIINTGTILGAAIIWTLA